MTIDITIRIKDEHHVMLKNRSEKEQRSIAAVVRLIFDEQLQVKRESWKDKTLPKKN